MDTARIARRLKGAYESLARRLPPQIAGLTDHLSRSKQESWRGPFNGQLKRRLMFEEMVRAYPFTAVVETGAYRGTTTDYLRRVSGLPVYTVEIDARQYYYCKVRFCRDPLVHVFQGDSRQFLREAATRTEFPKRAVFFYLDAHWQQDLPLDGEIALIAENWSDCVVLIDDFEVPDDPGYGFDDYGDGKRLCLESIPASRSGRFAIFAPAARSESETGERRGSLLLASKGAAEAMLSGLGSVRRLAV